jgi:putative zinc finger/helix-turn-helix YgiT family protein
MNTLVSTKNKEDSCPKCGNENYEVVVFSDIVDFRGMELDVENLEESKCRHCGYKWESKEQRARNESNIRASYAIIRDRLRKEHGLLVGSEIAEIREKFALSQREAASLFGGGYNAFNKYESGEVLQSYAMDRLLRLTDAVGKPAVDFLRDVFSPPNFKVVPVSKSESTQVVVCVANDVTSIQSIGIRRLRIETIGTSEVKELCQSQYLSLSSDTANKPEIRTLLN